MGRNVGFLRYWTLSNLPLFALAGPILFCFWTSTIWAWSLHDQGKDKDLPIGHIVLRRLSIPSATLGVLAFTTYHVQVLTRLSSGYPVWDWWLAWEIVETQKQARAEGALRRNLGIWVVRWMVMYGVIQAALFASFLPPA